MRAGVRRGWIELKHSFTTPGDLVPLVIWTAALLGVMLWTRTTTVPGTHFSLGTTMMASAIGMNVGFNGLATLGGVLAVEREDGTLLRAKAIPHGTTGYLIGKVVTVAATILISVAITLITGPFLFSGLALGNAGTWLTLIPVLLLGLAATLPIGAVLGSLIPSARSAGLLTLASGGLIAVSGIFYPITHLPQWLQWTGQVFPFYWLGLGMRSALLPATWPRWKSAIRGGTWLRSASSGRGPSSDSCWPRSCCAGWRGVSPGRAWPPAARKPCCE